VFFGTDTFLNNKDFIKMKVQLFLSILIAISGFSSMAFASVTCGFKPWETHKNSPILRQREKGAYLFKSNEIKLDADGAPNAYHPDDISLHCTKGNGFKGLDCPANAGYPKTNWWHTVIVPDPLNPSKGFTQTVGEYKGYFVSQTSLQDSKKERTDPSKYVDSTKVPYLVMPRDLHKKVGTGSLGDYGYALNTDNGNFSPFIIADVGPAEAQLGEMSIALAQALGGVDPNPRTGLGAPKGEVIFVVFPYTKKQPSWPITNSDINKKVDALLSAFGGQELLIECARAF
jgi:hypothetical protein